MGQRRTKVEVLNEKISKVDSKIAAYTEKIAALEDEKTALAAQLEEIHKAAKKAEETGVEYTEDAAGTSLGDLLANIKL